MQGIHVHNSSVSQFQGIMMGIWIVQIDLPETRNSSG
jgi:hypothetical protein